MCIQVHSWFERDRQNEYSVESKITLIWASVLFSRTVDFLPRWKTVRTTVREAEKRTKFKALGPKPTLARIIVLVISLKSVNQADSQGKTRYK